MKPKIKHLILGFILGLSVGCSSQSTVPAGIVQSDNESHHLEVDVGAQRYYGTYVTSQLRHGGTFAVKRISAVALTTNERTATLISIEMSDYSESDRETLRNGGTITIEDWKQQEARIMIGGEFIQEAAERELVILTADGEAKVELLGKLRFRDFESEASLELALREKLSAGGAKE